VRQRQGPSAQSPEKNRRGARACTRVDRLIRLDKETYRKMGELLIDMRAPAWPWTGGGTAGPASGRVPSCVSNLRDAESGSGGKHLVDYPRSTIAEEVKEKNEKKSEKYPQPPLKQRRNQSTKQNSRSPDTAKREPLDPIDKSWKRVRSGPCRLRVKKGGGMKSWV